MAKNYPIESPQKRRNLPPRHEPYWRQINVGLSLGYYRGAQGSKWAVRRMIGGRRNIEFIGATNDGQPADGVAVLSYRQAVEVAQEQTRNQPIAGSGYTVNHAIDAYLEHYRAEGKAIPDTESTFDTHVRPEFGKFTIATLTALQIKRWRNRLVAEPFLTRSGKKSRKPKTTHGRLRSRSTANRLLTYLKASLNHAYNEGYVVCDPVWRKVKPFRMASKPRVRWLTPDEVYRLVKGADADFAPMIQAAALTGCRYGEITRLAAADFYPGEHATIHVRESKGGSRYIPLTDEGADQFGSLTSGRKTMDRIFLRADGDPWGDAHQHRRMRKASRIADIEPSVAFHVVRHCYGSWLAQAGVPLQVISQAMGHSSTTITERYYAHLAPDFVAEQVRAHLPSLGGISRPVC